MKIIRWLLSHSLFILLIIAVIYAYMFWGNLLGKDTPAGKAVAYLSEEFVEVKDFVDAVKVKQAQRNEQELTAQASSAALTSASAEDTGTVQPGQTAAVVEVTAEKASQPVEQPAAVVAEAETEPAPVAETQNDMATEQRGASIASKDEPEQMPVQAPVQTNPVQKNPVQADRAALATGQQNTSANSNTQAMPVDADNALLVTNVYPGKKFVPAEVEKELENVDEHGEVINASQPNGAVREKWITARKSFYQRNYELSEKSYQEVIDSTKNNYDAYGELGNVYFNQGKDKQAASAYFEAAAILIKKGQVNRARSLMGLLRHLDESKATDLQKLVDAARS